MYRVGVIGLGTGKGHVRGFQAHPRTEVAALCSLDEPTMSAVAQEHGIAGQYRDYRAMLARERLDIVVVATPNGFHAEMAIAALESGRHVLVEKPMCTSLAECEAMVQAVERTGYVLAVNHILRFYPYWQAVHQYIKNGELGDIFYAEADYIHNTRALIEGKWRGDPAHRYYPILGGGCHVIDLLRWLVGEVDQVHCYGNRKVVTDHPFDDCMVAVLHFANGAVGKAAAVNGVQRPSIRPAVLYGTKGSIERARGPGDQEKLFAGPAAHRTEAQTFPVAYALEGGKPITRVVDDLLAALETGRPPLVDVREGANTTAVCLAAIRSRESGQPVRPARL